MERSGSLRSGSRVVASLLVLACSVGCGGTVLLGEREGDAGGADAGATDAGPLPDGGATPDTTTVSGDAGPGGGDAGVDAGDVPRDPSGVPITRAFDVREVDVAGIASTIEVDAGCSVVRNGKLLGVASATACAEFWAVVYDPKAVGAVPCSWGSTPFTMRLVDPSGSHTKTEKDYCAAGLPGAGGFKGAVALVYGLGGK